MPACCFLSCMLSFAVCLCSLHIQGSQRASEGKKERGEDSLHYPFTDCLDRALSCSRCQLKTSPESCTALPPDSAPFDTNPSTFLEFLYLKITEEYRPCILSSPFGFAYSFFTITFRSRLLQGPSCVAQEMVADSRQTPPFGCCGQNCMALSQLAGCFRASRSQNKPMCTLCRPELGKLGCWTSTAKPGTLNADPKKSKSLFSWHCRDAKGPGVVDEL